MAGPLRVLDLFSGIGGFSLGLERAGMKTVAFCEIDPFCRRVLAKHWPDVPCHEDITKLRGSDVGAVDVVCGGFPCQDISVAGKGAGLAGERSGLFYELARLIGEIRPRYAILENVSALLSRGLGDVLGELATLGYDAEWHCIPAAAVGAPHRRDRVWIVGYPNAQSQPAGSQHAEMAIMRGSLSDAISQRLALWQGVGSDHGQEQPPIERSRNGQNGHVANPSGASQDKMLQQGRQLSIEFGGICRDAGGHWLAEPDVGRVADGVPARTHRLRALGNAVVPQIPELIGRAILEVEGMA